MANHKVEFTSYGEASGAELKEILRIANLSHMPVMIYGDPGAGKTALVNQFCRDNGLGAPILIIGSTIEPTDVSGLPSVSEVKIPSPADWSHKGDPVDGRELLVKTTEYGAPWWQVEILTGKRKVIFLDEFSNSPASVQAAMLKLIGDRMFANGIKLPDDVFIIACSNPEDSAVDYTPLAAPMANRMLLVSYRATTQEVLIGLGAGDDCDWYTEEEKAAMPEAEKQWRQRIVDFHRATNGAYISKMPDFDNINIDSSAPAWMRPESENSASEREILQQAWCSPRSWDNLARVLGNTGYELEVTPLQDRIMSGMVGRAAAVYMTEHVHKESQIDPYDLIRNPEKQNWNVSAESGSTYNDIVQIARSINSVIHKCDGQDGRPTLEEALNFYDKVIDLGGGVHFMTAFCQDKSETAPGHWLKNNVPEGIEMAEWSTRVIDVLIKFRENDLIPKNDVEEDVAA